MNDCENLRQRIVEVKLARNQALAANAEAEDAGRPPAHDESALAEMRTAVENAARAARDAGCDISDLVGPGVGAR